MMLTIVPNFTARPREIITVPQILSSDHVAYRSIVGVIYTYMKKLVIGLAHAGIFSQGNYSRKVMLIVISQTFAAVASF